MKLAFYLTADTVMEAIRVQRRSGARGRGEVRDNPGTVGAQCSQTASLADNTITSVWEAASEKLLPDEKHIFFKNQL